MSATRDGSSCGIMANPRHYDYVQRIITAADYLFIFIIVIIVLNYLVRV